MAALSVAKLAARWCEMKKRSFRYDEGGDVNYGEDERPAATGMSAAAELMPEKPKAFKEAFRDARSAGDKSFTWQGKKYTTEMVGSKTVPPSGTPGGAYRGQRAEMPSRAASAEIPKSAASQGNRAVIPGGGQETEVEEPTPASRVREGMSDTAKKALMASGPLSMIGLGVGYKAYKASDTAKRAQIAKAIREGAESAPVTGGSTAARTTSETGRKFGPKAEMEAAESTMRGAVGRKDIQAKRAATAKGRAETMEANKPVLQATPKKASPRSRTEDRDVDYELRAKGGRIGYAKGGSVKGGGCEQRGLRKCKVM